MTELFRSYEQELTRLLASLKERVEAFKYMSA
jgi:hypothetical protein